MGKIEGIESNFNALDDAVKAGFVNLTKIITENQDKTDRRIDNLARDTLRASIRKRGATGSQRHRSATALQVIGYLLTALIGVGGLVGSFVGLAATFHSVTKAPIDATFARNESFIIDTSGELRAFEANIKRRSIRRENSSTSRSPDSRRMNEFTNMYERQTTVIAGQLEHDACWRRSRPSSKTTRARSRVSEIS